ncbi:MAG: hypothetical protein ACKOWO_05135 [Sediminibacterium sp.]
MIPLQSFCLATETVVMTQRDGMQMDWRLDLGVTYITLDKAHAYHFSAGFLQPSLNRFPMIDQWSKYKPSIELKYSDHGSAVVLISKEPDLIIYGFKIFTVQGQEMMHHQTKYMSAFLAKSINIQSFTSGIYILQVFYLPELMELDGKTPYLIKYIKFIKP